MLGHASVSITLDIYSHVLSDMQQDAAAAMASMLFIDAPRGMSIFRHDARFDA